MKNLELPPNISPNHVSQIIAHLLLRVEPHEFGNQSKLPFEQNVEDAARKIGYQSFSNTRLTNNWIYNRNGLTMTLLDVYKVASSEGRRVNIFISDFEGLRGNAHDLALNYPCPLVNIFDANQIFIEAARVDDCGLIPDQDV